MQNLIKPKTLRANIYEEYSSLRDFVRLHLKKSIFILVRLNESSNEAFVYDIGGLIIPLQNKLSALLGINPIKKNFIVTDEDIGRHYHSNKMVRFDGDVYDFAGGRFPRWLCNSLEKIFDVKDIYSIGIKHEGVVLGSLIVFPRGNEEERFGVINKAMPFYARRMKEWLDINQMDKEYNIRNRFIKAILDNISHEIRTPLNGIVSLMDVGLKLLDANEDTKLLTNAIWQNSNELTSKLDNLLLIADFEAETVRFKMGIMTLNSVVYHMDLVIRKLENEFKGRDIVIDNKLDGGSMEINADRYFLEIAFIELMRNALKFSEDKVTVSLKKNDGISICICDRGIGVSEIETEYLFDLFYRCNNCSCKYPGMGLGLNIVSQIVKRHNWKLVFESEKGIGSSFTIKIPVVS